MSTNSKFTIVGLGELLWDLFSEGKQLGGAPANFAYMTSLLGDIGIVASRVGSDDLGGTARQRLEGLRLTTSYVQSDSIHATGTVKVEVDPSGQPTFQIAQPVAWDFFEWSPEWRSLAESSNDSVFPDRGATRHDAGVRRQSPPIFLFRAGARGICAAGGHHQGEP